MNLLTKDMMPELLSMKKPAYHYMPTHRTHPDNLRIRYYLKNLLKAKTIPTQKHSESSYNTAGAIARLKVIKNLETYVRGTGCTWYS
jgi:hypothetical protein